MSLPKAMNAIHLPVSPTYTYANPCRASSLLISTFPVPTPSPTQALIRVHATAISPYELTWEGAYTLPKPRIPCFDIAGTIVSSSPSSGFEEDDRVFGLLDYLGQGGMAEFAVCEAGLLARIPENLGFVEAASLPRAALTAWQAIHGKGRGMVGLGSDVLVTGATGAVGRMGVQILRDVVGETGRVIAVGGKGSEVLKELGADFVVDYRETRDWEDAVRKEGEVDWAFDCIGGETLEKCLKVVKNGGQVVTIGAPPPVWVEVKGWKEAEARRVEGLFFIVEENGEQLVEVGELARKGVVKPSVSLVVDGLTEEGVRNSWTRAEKGGLSGSVVVKIL